MVKVVKIAIIALSGLGISIFLAIAIPKILYPYEMHWMEGSILDQIQRLLDNKPLYSKPSIYYVPWLYPPLYYYVAAKFASLFGLSYFIARLPSIISTLALCFILWKIVKKETANRVFAFGAIGLFVASYARTEFSMVMARIDPLFTLLVVSAFVTAYYFSNWKGVLLSALLLAASYFTKQTGVVFAPSIIIYLWLLRSRRDAILFASAVAVFILIGTIWLDHIYDGWFSYYTATVPNSGKFKTLRWGYAINGFFVFIFMRCWWISILSALSTVLLLVKKRADRRETPQLFFGLFFLTAIAAGTLGILNNGGGHNVLLPAAVACGLFIPLFAANPKPFSRYRQVVLWVIPLQILFLLSMPWITAKRSVLQADDKIHQETFHKYVTSLSGEVWVPYHGHLEPYTNKTAYADLNAMRDVMLVNDSVATDLKSDYSHALAGHHWDYILSDLPDTIPQYKVVDTMENLNKILMWDDTRMYIYRPETP